MKSVLIAVDRASTWLGQAFAWLIVILTCLISWEVFSRYVLNNPHDWALDAQIMMYGTLFMMAGAYTLAKAGHVRGDVLYGFFEPRTQATICGAPKSRCRMTVRPRGPSVTFTAWANVSTPRRILSRASSPSSPAKAMGSMTFSMHDITWIRLNVWNT